MPNSQPHTLDQIATKVYTAFTETPRHVNPQAVTFITIETTSMPLPVHCYIESRQPYHGSTMAKSGALSISMKADSKPVAVTFDVEQLVDYTSFARLFLIDTDGQLVAVVPLITMIMMSRPPCIATLQVSR